MKINCKIVLIFLFLVSCATLRVPTIKEGEQIFGKGRLYLKEGIEKAFFDFFFFYERNKLKIDGLSIIGTPVFHIYISEKAYLIIPRMSSYWKGDFKELTKFFLSKEISRDEIFSFFSGGKPDSFEIKNFFKNPRFPKEIKWREEGKEGLIKIKWIKGTSGVNFDVKIPSSFKIISLEEVRQ